MAKRFSPTAIGAFVVASLAILVVAVVVVGSGRLFRKPVRFICMFSGNLNGLRVGAPVKVRGVQIGTVAEIKLRLAPSEGKIRPGINQFRIPVVLDLDQSQLIAQGASSETLTGPGLESLLRRGLRAQLSVESILTGLLYVDLDLHPQSSMDLILVPGSSPYLEIPTVPTTMQTIQDEATKALKNFERIDFQALTTALTNAANSIKDLMRSPELEATLRDLRDSTVNLNRTLSSIRVAVNNTNDKVDPLTRELRANSAQVNQTLNQTRAVLLNLQTLSDPHSPLAVHLNDTLRQLSNAAQSISQLADYLHQNPSALIRGRYVPGK